MGTSMMDWARRLRCHDDLIECSACAGINGHLLRVRYTCRDEQNDCRKPHSLAVCTHTFAAPGSCLDTLAFSANLLMESLEQTCAGTFTGLMALLTFLALDLRSSHELHEMRV